MFENEWFPKANAIGISWQEFWGMNPHIIKLLMKGHQEKLKEQDYLAWMFNQYTLSAVFVSVEHNLFGKKATSEYIKKPLLSDMEIAEKEEITEEKRIEMENQKLAMTLRIMQANFEINKKKTEVCVE